jgi:hypothetical protein
VTWSCWRRQRRQRVRLERCSNCSYCCLFLALQAPCCILPPWTLPCWNQLDHLANLGWFAATVLHSWVIWVSSAELRQFLGIGEVGK